MAQELQVKQLVDKERKVLSRLGGRKLHHQIRDSLQAQEIRFGRDKLFALLKKERHAYSTQTQICTNYDVKALVKEYPNLVKDIVIKRPDEVWVSDITYLKTDEGNCYLNMELTLIVER